MKYQTYFWFMLFAGFIVSCEKNPIIPNEEELITTMTYTLIPQSGGSPVVFSFRDLDGDGGQDPVITFDTLARETPYSGTLQLLNESVIPNENITDEVEEEGADHQLFYLISVADAAVQYADLDTSGFPIGLDTYLHTGAGTALPGTLTIVLRHLPMKTAGGVSQGLIQNAGGETDIEVTFPLIIQ